MYGGDMHRRGQIAEKHLPFLLQALGGEPFEYEGRHIHVTTAPVAPAGRRCRGAAARSPPPVEGGRYALDFFGQREGDELRAAYDDEIRKHGHGASCQHARLRPRSSSPTTSTARGTSSART